MALPVWPAGLPLADFSRKPTTPFVRTPMDDGLARHRRRFRVYPIVMPVSFLMDEDTYATYSNFAEGDLDGWVNWFMLKVRDKSGIRYARVRFIAAPEEVLVAPNGLWRVSGQVETLNISFLVTEQTEDNIASEQGDKFIME